MTGENINSCRQHLSPSTAFFILFLGPNFAQVKTEELCHRFCQNLTMIKFHVTYYGNLFVYLTVFETLAAERE